MCLLSSDEQFSSMQGHWERAHVRLKTSFKPSRKLLAGDSPQGSPRAALQQRCGQCLRLAGSATPACPFPPVRSIYVPAATHIRVIDLMPL